MTEPLALLSDTVNRILARALRYAPATRQRLADIGPQTWRVVIEDQDLSLDLASDGSTLGVHAPDDRVPDALIRGDSQSFLALLRETDKTAALAGSSLRIEGSTRSFMQLQQLISEPDLDWESALGDVIGDLPAQGVTRGARRAWSGATGFARGAQHATGEYLVREKQWLVTRPEVDPERERLHALRRRLDRLEQRLRQQETGNGKGSH